MANYVNNFIPGMLHACSQIWLYVDFNVCYHKFFLPIAVHTFAHVWQIRRPWREKYKICINCQRLSNGTCGAILNSLKTKVFLQTCCFACTNILDWRHYDLMSCRIHWREQELPKICMGILLWWSQYCDWEHYGCEPNDSLHWECHGYQGGRPNWTNCSFHWILLLCGLILCPTTQ